MGFPYDNSDGGACEERGVHLKKRILLWTIVFILLAFTASASITQDLTDSLIFNADFNGSSDSLCDTVNTSRCGTITLAGWNTTSYAGLTNALNFSGNSKVVYDFTDNLILENMDFTIVICSNEQGAGDIVASDYDGSDGYSIGSDRAGFFNPDAFSTQASTNGGAFACKFLTFNNTNNTGNYFQNSSSLFGATSITNANYYSRGTGETWLGARPDGAYNFQGLMILAQIFNQSLNDTEIDYIAENANWLGAGTPATTDDINISTAYPLDGYNTTTSTIEFNLTTGVNSSYDLNCTLFLNDTSNQTNEYSAGNSIPVNFTQDLNDGAWTYYISCIDLNGTSENSTAKNIWIDSLQPTITWNFPSASNDSVIAGTLPTNITVSDANLYSYYYNITHLNGTTFYNYTNISLTGQSSYTITDNPSLGIHNGRLFATVKTCDGHTANMIDIVPDKTKDELRFDNVKIYLNDKEHTDSLNYFQNSDRYTFNFITKQASSTQVFVVEGESYVDILHGQTDYLGHLVVDGKYWVDFENPKIRVMSTQRISDKKVLVGVTLDKATDLWTFNSIGELNCNQETTEFYSLNYTYSYLSNVLAGESNPFYFNLTYNSSWVTSATVNLHHNNIGYSMGSTIQGTVINFSRYLSVPTTPNNYSVIFEYIINGDSYNTSEENQSVIVPAIDNCSAYSSRWINFTIKDEISGANLSGDISYIFTYTSGSYSSTYNGSAADQTHYDFCVDPSWANFTTDAIIQYSVDGYDTRDWIGEDYVVDNITDSVVLYSLSTGNSTEITIHVVDQGDDNLESVLVEVEKYNLDTGEYVLVESEYTDSGGICLVDLNKGTTYYRFKLYQDGVLIEQTNRFKIFVTTLEFVLADAETTVLQEYLQVRTISSHLFYDNTTKLVTFTWNDTNDYAAQICLNVTDLSQSYYSECSTADTDTLTYTILTLNQTYTAQGIAVVSSGNSYVIATLGIDELITWRVLGQGLGLMLGLVIFLVITMISLVNAKLAVIGAAVAFIMLYFLQVIPLTLLGLMGVISLVVIALIAMRGR